MVTKELADKLTGIACKQLEAGVKFKQPRMDTIKKIEDLYNNKTFPALDGRINVPIPFMAGHIDTMHAKIDSRPKVEFVPTEEADIKLSEKVTAAWRVDSSSMKGAWARKDRQEKKQALISGRGIAKIYSESIVGKYKSCYDLVDYHDFVCEGTQGHLEDNLYCGQMNIFRSKAELQAGARAKFYNVSQVQSLVAATTQEDFKNTDDLYKNKVNRLQALGLDPLSHTYVGQEMFNLTEWCMEYEGTRYFLLFDHKTGIWIRAEKLVELFPCGEDFPKGLYPYVSWATHDEAFAFWTKGYGDDVMPVAEAMKIIVNQVLTNIIRQNQPMRAIDPNTFPDPNELTEYIPDHVIITKGGANVPNSVYTFETPAITGSIDLVQYLDAFLGKKTGVTADAQGAAESDVKVGVYYGNVQQVADRVGLVEKNYNESYAEKGYRYYWGLRTHMTEKKLVKMIGKGGVQWDEITKGELKDAGDFDIMVSGGTQEAELDAVKQKQKAEALAQVMSNPESLKIVSRRWFIENQFKLGGFTEEDIQQALDPEGDESREIMNEASAAIQEIMQGKTPRLNRGANTAFLQKILDFDTDNLDYIKLDKNGNQIGVDEKVKEQSERLQAYANAHYNIVIQNMKRKAMKQAQMEQDAMVASQIEKGAAPESSVTLQDGDLASLRPGELPAGTSEGTAQRSQNLSEMVTA